MRALTVDAAAETAADGFLRRLDLNATIDDQTTEKVLLPVPGGETTVDRAALVLSFGEGASEEWNGSIDIDKLTTETFGSDKVAITLSGLAQNLSQPASRRISFSADGCATGIVSDRADVQEALGDRIALDIEGDWNAGQPVKLAKALLAGKRAERLACRRYRRALPSRETSRSMLRASRRSPSLLAGSSPAASTSTPTAQ